MPITITHHNRLPASERAVVDQFWAGNTTIKGQARQMGVSPYTVADYWHRIILKLDMPFGTKREQAIVALIDRGLIDVARRAAALAFIALCLQSGIADSDMYRRPPRSTRTTRTAGTGRTGRHDPIQTLIADLMEGIA